MFTTRILASVFLVAGVVGCTHNPSPAARSHADPNESRSSDVITATELASPSVRSGDALEAVRRLRPRFLTTRGSGSIGFPNAGTVHVSLDGGPLLTLSFLSRMRPGEIAEIRYLDANQAAQRFGTASGTGGVMLVKSR